jgi:hypothetical protein
MHIPSCGFHTYGNKNEKDGQGMGKFLAFLIALLMGWTPLQEAQDKFTYKRMQKLQAMSKEENNFLRGVWLSQFDMQPLYRDGNKQRDSQQFYQTCVTLCKAFKTDGFNTVFLQLRPNGDSMYESDLFPLSKYVAGQYGGEIEYDPIPLFLVAAKENGIVPVVSHRSGETTDDTIAQLAVAFSAPMIKTGAIGGERIAKLNELIRIEEKLPNSRMGKF